MLIFSVSLLVQGCKDDSEQIAADQMKKDQEAIDAWLTENKLNSVKTDSGLHYIETKEGEGGHPAGNSDVTVNYKGSLLNGHVFDETKTKPATFNLQGLIEGWKEGIPMMKKGGKATLVVPSALGYGSQATSGIPANSVLVFEIELVDFK
ncbi:MAG: peptidylprolyl isomerase [Bacteroidetes bacterium]|nr:peptidylprolyl isomerase [Bacteroidota bacterium]